jgi:hypothetical protein
MRTSGERANVQPPLWSGGTCSQRLARELSCALATLAVAGTVALLLRRWHVRHTPLAMAKHLNWLSHPESPRSSRKSYRSVARLIEWFDALPVDRGASFAAKAD